MNKKSRNPNRVGAPANDNVTSIKTRKKGTDKKFDYQTVPDEKRVEVRTRTRTIKKLLGRRLSDTVEVGLELLQVKNLLQHGDFRPWLRSEFHWSERTATSYMELARNFEGKTAKFSDLDLGTAMALISKTTPTEIRDEIFEAAGKGEAVSRETVRKRIAEGKAAQRKSAAKKADPGDVKRVETLPAAGKSPAEEVAVAMLNLLRALEKNGLHCKADDVAELLLEDQSKHLPPKVSECADFVNDVATGLAVLMPQESEVGSELRALAS